VAARANPGLLATLEEARDSGKTTVSNQTTLPGDQDLPAGRRPVAFELVVPVYRVELRPDAPVAERRRRFLGWATGQFRAGDILDEAMQNVAPTTGVELHDLEAGSDSRVASHPRDFRAGGRYVRESTFTLGEEFSLLLPDCRLDNGVEIAERLRTAQPEVTCSIGVAAWDGRESADELITRADRALYAAKPGGRNRCLAARPPVASRVP
jgi:CHASE domain/Diguanylate cyclase, GGDEF domain